MKEASSGMLDWLQARRASPALALVLVVGFALPLGCWEPMPPEMQEFFALGLNERGERLLDYPLDKQVDIYLWGECCVHPPASYLADDLARNGRPLVPILLRRIREAEREFYRLRLLRVLSSMTKSHGVRLEPAELAHLDVSVAGIEDAGYRLVSEGYAERIRSRSMD